ncbi:MAG TPA: TonB-dependent receptor [Steroidobacteraceae bacterium]|nr:TonB-dependent receptor [Steroidobacteraceae bacterium]
MATGCKWKYFPLLLGLLGAARAPAAEDSSAINNLKQLDVQDLLNVEVTSVSRHAAPLAEAPSAIQVITAAQIRRSGATTLAAALQLADNLQVAQRGASGWSITARGFNTDLANKLLVMIDGRTVYTPLYSGVFWDAQDYLLEDIDRIEVISGPGGTLWGANAVNGVINIITKKAADTQGLYAEGGGGNETRGIAGLRFGGSTPQVNYRVYGKYLDFDDSALPDGSPAGDAWHRGQAGFRMDAPDSTLGAWTLQGDYYSNHEHSPTGTSVLGGENLLGRWSREHGEDSGFSLQVYYDRTTLSLPVAPLTIAGLVLSPPGTLHDELQTFDVDFQHRLQLGGINALTWGLGFRDTHDALDNAPAVAFVPDRLDQQLYSAFLQDEIQLAAQLALTVGSKVEHNDYTGYEFEPSVRLQWQVAPAHTLWSAVSRAVRAPSRIDRDLQEGPAPYLSILHGSSDFRSENLLAYELGYRASVGESFTSALSTFYNVYKDVRSTAITPATVIPFYFQNGVQGHTWGAEWTGTLQLTDDWSLRAGYVLLQEKLHVKPGYFDLSNARNETADPQQQASLHSSLDLPGGVAVDLGLRWVDTLRNSDAQQVGTVPAYMDLDARLAWRASRNLELSLDGANLLHDQHPEYGFPSPQRTEIERSVYAKLVWRQ